MIDVTNLAFAEIADIINHLDKDLYNKIPNKFLKMINLMKDRTFKINIDYSRDINDQILHETKVILGLMYRDYFVSDEEREKLKEKEQEQLAIIETKRQEQYNPNNIFKKGNSQEYDKNTTSLIKIEKKKTFLQKLIDIIRKAIHFKK